MYYFCTIISYLTFWQILYPAKFMFHLLSKKKWTHTFNFLLFKIFKCFTNNFYIIGNRYTLQSTYIYNKYIWTLIFPNTIYILASDFTRLHITRISSFKYVRIYRFFRNKSDYYLYLYIRNLENSRLKHFFCVHNIHLYLCW